MENTFEEELLNVDLQPVQELLKNIISKTFSPVIKEYNKNKSAYKIVNELLTKLPEHISMREKVDLLQEELRKKNEELISLRAEYNKLLSVHNTTVGNKVNNDLTKSDEVSLEIVDNTTYNENVENKVSEIYENVKISSDKMNNDNDNESNENMNDIDSIYSSSDDEDDEDAVDIQEKMYINKVNKMNYMELQADESDPQVKQLNLFAKTNSTLENLDEAVQVMDKVNCVSADINDATNNDEEDEDEEDEDEEDEE